MGEHIFGDKKLGIAAKPLAPTLRLDSCRERKLQAIATVLQN